MSEYLSELENCTLCEWRCGVNRLESEMGVCKLGKPEVASKTLHPAPPQSFTVFLDGCNFKCLGCQNWEIANFPDSGASVLKDIGPKELAEEAVRAINSPQGQRIGADRIFFSGGSPTPSLPLIEKVVEEADKIGNVRVNYDTNGFLTPSSLERVIDIADSITYDIKAFREEVHRALTGAPVEPVLRNAERISKENRDKLWEFRILVIPNINESEIEPISEFLADIDRDLPVKFLAFRPNFALEDHPGASEELMEKAVETARQAGLENVGWSGRTDISGNITGRISEKYETKGGKTAGGIAEEIGCITHPRDCGACDIRKNCPVKKYRAQKRS